MIPLQVFKNGFQVGFKCWIDKNQVGVIGNTAIIGEG